jgi:hypothetical protein
MVRNSLAVASRLVLVAAPLVASPPLAAGGPVTPYGAATPGTAGVAPRIAVDGEPRLGNAGFALTLDGALAGAPVALVLGLTPASLSLGGALLLVDPSGPLFTVVPRTASGGGAARLDLPLPSAAGLEGSTFVAQWLVADPAGPAGIAASAGLRITVRRGAALLGATASGLETVPQAGGVAFTPWSTSGVLQASVVGLTRDGRTALLSQLTFPFAVGLEFYDVAAEPAVSLGVVASPRRLVGAALHPTQDLAYVASNDPTGGPSQVDVIDLQRGAPSFGQVVGSVVGLSSPLGGTPTISPDGRRLAVPAFGEVALVDVEPGSATRHQVVGRVRVNAIIPLLALSADGRALFSVALASTALEQYDIASGARVATASLAASAHSLAASNDGRYLLASHAQLAQLTVLDLTAPGLAQRAIATSAPVRAFALSADAASVVVAVEDRYEIHVLANGLRFWTSTSPSAGAAGLTGLGLR